MPSWQAKTIDVRIISAMPRRGLSARGGAAGMSAGSGAPTLSSGPRRRRARAGRPRAGRRRGEITSPAAMQPMRAQVSQSRPVVSPCRKPAAKRSPAPVASTTRDRGRRRVHARRRRPRTCAPRGADRAGGDRHLGLGARHRRLEVVGQVERPQLVLVGDQQVDVGADHPQELVAVALDAERVGERDRDPAAGRACVARIAFAKAAMAVRPVEAVALEEDPLGRRPSAPRRCRRAPRNSETPR